MNNYSVEKSLYRHRRHRVIFLDSQIQMILIKATSENVYYDAIVLLKISGLVSELTGSGHVLTRYPLKRRLVKKNIEEFSKKIRKR